MTSAESAGNAVHLLTPGRIRELAARLEVRPTKTLGQNFVIDPGTVRRIVRTAGVEASHTVVEVGPGLGSLTLGLLETGAHVIAVEIDPVLAGALEETVVAQAPGAASRLTVIAADAMEITELPAAPDRLVANLPYNVAVPVLLQLLQHLPSLREVLVMVQAEVADRIAAGPGSRTYGVPSAKAAWYASASRAGSIGRSVFWPVPNVDSALVRLVRRDPPVTTATRADVFACIDAAFSQRRKTLRSALAGWAGSADLAEQALRAAGVDPTLRGERLDITQFAAVAAARTAR
ncbi:16S rRNA (adenine(1518)-N(6)/adenine(1519)-N(6))-dimethyltransferase RsmA [Ruania alba]|uniref:Ribosomal RNA small subunit methyltransferase A n=1 Tax=Ruania alba TaxID=648782 RepID=A0A1H5N2M7_9MICO|nr:16S rRNA (adenine(1518)-N(6)/adenine(1519)-N(6))-dimethyltransferase RsmA [Ruania alba]SEE95690.1 dimethyladenosine transferase [Ruania alba]